MDCVCRVCLISSTDKQYHSLLTIFPEFSDKCLCVLDLLTIVTSSEVTFTDKLPNNICLECFETLKQAYEFIILYEASQATLIQNSDQQVIKTDDKLEGEVFEENIFIVTENSNDENDIDDDRYLDEDSEENNEETCDKKTEYVKNNVIMVSIEDVLQDEKELLEQNCNLNEKYSDGHETTEESEFGVNEEPDFNCKETMIKSDKVLSIEDVLKIKQRKKLKRNCKDNDEYICGICNNKYDSSLKLNAHQKQIHNPEWREKFKCSKCGEQCKTVSGFRYHMRKHDGKKYACEQCEKIYLTSTLLKEHIRRVHEKKLNDKYFCAICGKGFKFKNALDYHMHVHTNIRDFVCRFCGFKSVTSSALKRHERTHTGERPYNCRYCERNFAGSAERLKHELGHKGLYPYKCKYCQKPFIQMYNMRVHWLQHTGSFSCEMCRKSFIDSDVLNFHYNYTHKKRQL